MSTSPRTFCSVFASGASGSCAGSSISSKMRPAHASAFCSYVMTPEISLNGLVYWFA